MAFWPRVEGKKNELASSKVGKNKIIWNELQVILKKFNVIYKTISLFESRDYQSPLEASLAENRTTFCNNLLYIGQQTLQQPIPVDFLGFFTESTPSVIPQIFYGIQIRRFSRPIQDNYPFLFEERLRFICSARICQKEHRFEKYSIFRCFAK